MMTEWVTYGRSERGRIAWAPPSPMAKSISLVPGAALASRIACRSEPAPALSVLTTIKVEGSHRPSRDSRRGRKSGGRVCRRGRDLEQDIDQRIQVSHTGRGMDVLLEVKRD
jgi:hypothetical protein